MSATNYTRFGTQAQADQFRHWPTATSMHVDLTNAVRACDWEHAATVASDLLYMLRRDANPPRGMSRGEAIEHCLFVVETRDALWAAGLLGSDAREND